MPEIHIGERAIGDGHPCYVIAEACINHDGDFATALRMAEAARAAGADAVKYQVHYLEHEMLRDVPTSGNFSKPLWDVLEETNLTDEQYLDITNNPSAGRAVSIGYRLELGR